VTQATEQTGIIGGMPSDIRQEKKPSKRSNMMEQFDNMANTSNLIRTPAEYKYTKVPEVTV
jgi:hypothetical protein